MAYPLALKASLALAAALAFTAAPAANPSKDEMKASEDRIEADYKSAKAACDKLSGNEKDVCMAEAKGKQKVAKAELQANASGKETDRAKVALARADANYDVAKERCDDKKGNDKDVCVKDAKAQHTKAKEDAKVAQNTAEDRREAADDKRDAQYKAARERCDTMSGDAKDKCVADAKARYGKS
jgi:hypothetical protein